MRLLTFSFLKSCKYKKFCSVSRSISTVLQPEVLPAVGDPNLVEVSPSWKESEEPALRSAVLRDMQVYPDFISEHEEAALLTEVEPVLRRMRYEFDHWDNAIHGFRETERRQWSPENSVVLARVRALALGGEQAQALPHVHVLDLAAAGHIKPHIDAVRVCISSLVISVNHSFQLSLTSLRNVCGAVLRRRDRGAVPGVECGDAARAQRQEAPRAQRAAGTTCALCHERSGALRVHSRGAGRRAQHVAGRSSAAPAPRGAHLPHGAAPARRAARRAARRIHRPRHAHALATRNTATLSYQLVDIARHVCKHAMQLVGCTYKLKFSVIATDCIGIQQNV